MSVTEPPRPTALPSDQAVREDASSMTLAERPRRRLYQYEPLRNPKSDIRVLKLLPSGEPDELHCSLETCSLDDKPFYVAVSYEWGEPEPLVDITVNGKPFRIRHNLWLFLNYLQNNKSDLVMHDHFRLWADAICIDQTNLTEKGTQVQIMSRIFKDADSVFAWLGHTTRLHTKATFRFIKGASFLGQATSPMSDDDYSRWNEEFIPKEITSCHVYYGSLLEIWKEILQLSRLPYWSRRWVVQELVISREITLLLDGEELPWSAIAAIFRLLQRDLSRRTSGPVSEVLSELLHTIPLEIRSHRGRVGRGARHVNPFEPLLQSFRQTFCTVAYDKVYAFLGLVDNGYSIEVDYGCSMIELFCKVVSIGGTAMLSANLIGILATELVLSSELDKKHMVEPKGVGPFVTYSAKLSELVRIVHVDLGEDSVFDSLDTSKYEHSREEKYPRFIPHDALIHAKRLAKEHQIFDTNLIYSRVKHDPRYNVFVRNKKVEVSTCKEDGGILNLDRIPSSPSSTLTESLKFTYVVLEDESIGLSCSLTLPGDFLCPLGQRKWLVLRNCVGLFAIVGTASVVISKSDVPLMFQSASHHLNDRKPKSHPYGVSYDWRLQQYNLLLYHLLLQRYKALQESLRKGSFAYTWVEQTNPIMKAPGESNEDAFDEEGGRAQVWQPASANSREFAAPAKDQEVGVEASFMPETLSTSSIDILFNGWELVQHAPKWKYLEKLHPCP